jgi:hypothetical protein
MKPPKRQKSTAGSSGSPNGRASLPADLEQRLQLVWRQFGPWIDWCDNETAWLQAFCAEARPYRETFYWEAVARLTSAYAAAHPTATPARVLTECLIATQCPPTPDDRAVLIELYQMWRELLRSSQSDVQAWMQRDLELAQQEGTHASVAALYAADGADWQCQ